MVAVRRIAFNKKRIDAIKRQLKAGTLPDWAKQTESRNGVLHIDDKEVVPKGEVADWLRGRVYSEQSPPCRFHEMPGTISSSAVHTGCREESGLHGSNARSCIKSRQRDLWPQQDQDKRYAVAAYSRWTWWKQNPKT
jgi:hypothetical protein